MSKIIHPVAEGILTQFRVVPSSHPPVPTQFRVAPSSHPPVPTQFRVVPSSQPPLSLTPVRVVPSSHPPLSLTQFRELHLPPRRFLNLICLSGGALFFRGCSCSRWRRFRDRWWGRLRCFRGHFRDRWCCGRCGCVRRGCFRGPRRGCHRRGQFYGLRIVAHL